MTNSKKFPLNPKSRNPSIRIPRLHRVADEVSQQLSQLVKQQVPVNDHRLDETFQAICRYSQTVNKLLIEKQFQITDLSQSSQRSLLFLRYLSDPRHFGDHCNTISELYAIVKKGSGHVNGLTIEMANTASIYRCHRSINKNHLVIQEGFIHAPSSILIDLAAVTLAQRSSQLHKERLKRIKAYTNSPEYKRINQDLKPELTCPPDSPRGRYFDLAVIFEKINKVYFGGNIACPNLVWTRNPTRRKLGHYQPDKDTIAISRNLDSPRTNETLLGFIMYHEMLHKSLGVKIVNGRRYAHTTEFRKAERQYHDYEFCQQLLKNSRWTAK